MAGQNSDAPSDPLAGVPDRFDGARLVGIDGTGVPIYFDAANNRAFEALESNGEWAVGEERANADLAAIVDEIERLVGWTALSELGASADTD